MNSNNSQSTQPQIGRCNRQAQQVSATGRHGGALTKIYSYSQPIETPVADAFCALQKGFTDQFVYYDKSRPNRYLGLGRCIALPDLRDVEYCTQGPTALPTIMFSFNRFDAGNPAPCDELFASFPQLALMLPEIVLIENEEGCFLQVNSLGPVYAGRVARFARLVAAATHASARRIPISVEPDSPSAWKERVDAGLDAIRAGRVSKVVLSRRQRVCAEQPFSSKDVLVNLIEGASRGTVIMYRYGDVFFCGCTPELLVRKSGAAVESMCLAGTTSGAGTQEERAARAAELLHDEKNLVEHAYVAGFMREVFGRTCYDVNIPTTPSILALQHVQHLYTPVTAKLLEGKTLVGLMEELHPTPALSGYPVGEALMLIRAVEPYSRGLFGGAAGYVDADGNGEFSVALRTGVFDGETGWVYAGCGIVEGSDADSEYEETTMKMQTVLGAFEGSGASEGTVDTEDAEPLEAEEGGVC